jgi:hypothetical protein
VSNCLVKTQVIFGVFLLPVLALPSLMKAQEIKYIDLTAVRQRTELRYPPAPQLDCGAGKGVLAVIMAVAA